MKAIEIKNLHCEVERYLAAIDVFRREGCEPRWLPESSALRVLSPGKPREIPQAA